MRMALLAVAGCLAACAALEPAPRNPWPKPTERVTSAGAYLQIVGAGKPDRRAGSKTQRRSTSRDAAIADARAQLQDYVRDIRRPDGATVGARADSDPEARRKLEALSPRLDVVETHWDDDDNAAVIVRVEKSSLLEALGL